MALMLLLFNSAKLSLFLLLEASLPLTAFTRLRRSLSSSLGSLSMQRFWGTDGNRKLTFRTPEQWSFLDFQTCGRYYWKRTEQYKCGGVKTT